MAVTEGKGVCPEGRASLHCEPQAAPARLAAGFCPLAAGEGPTGQPLALG